MKIKLKNIRQHKALEGEFPDNGIVRIKGPSGVGKTTIFDAIRQACYGDVSGMTHWDEASSKIELDWLGLQMVRTMRPNAFKLTKDGKAFVDDEAEHEVVKKLDMTSEEFMASSYVQQEFADSLLTLTPADQLRLIERLAFGDDDPGVTKAKIQAIIAQRLVEVRVAEAEVEKAETEYGLAFSAKQNCQHLAKPDLLSDAGIDEGIAQTERVAAAAAKDVDRLVEEERNPDYETKKLLEIREAELVEAKKQHTPLIEESLQRIASIPTAEGLEQLKTEHSTSRASLEFFRYQKRIAEITKGMEAYPVRDSRHKLFDRVCEEVVVIGRRLEELRKLRRETNERLGALQRAKDSLACPECSAKLRYVEGRLVPHSHDTPDYEKQEAVCAKIVEACDKESDELQPKIDVLLAFRAELLQIKDAMAGVPKPALKTEDEVLEHVASLEARLDDLKALAAKRQAEEMIVKSSQQTIKKAEDAVTQLGLKLGRTPLRDREVVRAELAEARKKSDEASAQWRAWITRQSEVAKSKTAYTVWKVQEEKVIQAQKALESAQARVTKAKTALAEAQGKHAAAVRLKEISDVAAMEAIGAIFQAINFNAKAYIDKMFPETGTQVVLRNKKELSSGQERAKPSLYVYHKGSVVKNFKELSGGEKGRIKLAFHLALSDLYRSPILMLDEPFIGMDETARELALDCLENISQNKLVMIVEHNMQDSQAGFVFEV